MRLPRAVGRSCVGVRVYAPAVRRALCAGGVAACLLAACGGDAPSKDEIADCLRDGGATVEIEPAVSADPGTPGWAPEFTPETELVVRAELSEETEVEVYESSEDRADRAEERAKEFLRLFGLGDDRLVRNDTMLLLIGPTSAPEDRPKRDTDLARGCVD
jgi:hypothetical protein